MQLRTGSMPGLTDISDHVTAVNRLAGSNLFRDSRKMGIAGNISIVVANLHHAPVTAPSARKGHLPMSNGNHRCATGGGIIDCLVRPYGAKDRVSSIDPERR